MIRHRDRVPLVLCLLFAACGAGAKQPAAPVKASTPSTVSADIHDNTFFITVTRGDATTELVAQPAELDGYDQVTSEVQEIEGSRGRLYIAQLFQEVGEDEFSRKIGFWVVDALTDKVLWSGQGTFSNSFDTCITIDVPWAKLEGNEVVVTREQESAEGCEAPAPLAKTVEARVKLD